jgi:hypothetical protein
MGSVLLGSQNVISPAKTVASAGARATGQNIPWYVWTSALAVTATSVGLPWDISWHMSIGRDTFWTPAHLAIHFGAIVAGLSSIFLILSTTFGKDQEQRGRSVRMWGFYGPLGAFVSLMGRPGDADLRSLRRLVAQRLWARRANHEPAARGAHHGHLRTGLGRAVPDRGRNEPCERRPTRKAEPLVPLCRLHADDLAVNAHLRIHRLHSVTQRRLLSRLGAGDAAGAGRDCASFRLAGRPPK